MQPFTQHNESRRRGISSLQLAAHSRSDFDIPPRTRRLIAVAGAAGIVVIAVGSEIVHLAPFEERDFVPERLFLRAREPAGGPTG